MVNKHKNSHCFLCYKPAARESELNEQNETTYSRNNQKFLSLLLRHLKIQLHFNKIKKEFLCCEDCLLLGDSFCDLYFQLECIQLQLNWKLKRVYDTMFYAGRVPSRVNAFRTQFDKDEDEQDQDKEKQKRIFSEIQETRKNLMKNCKLKLKSSKPQVVLKRISTNGQKQAGEQIKIEKLSPKKVNSTSSSTVISSNCSLKLDKYELLAVLVSYVAVLHLSLPTHPSLIPDTFYIHEGLSLIPNFDIDTLADMDFRESRDEEDKREGEDECMDDEVPHFPHSPQFEFAHEIISEADAEYAEESPKSNPLDGSIEADYKIEQEIETDHPKKNLAMDESSCSIRYPEPVPNEKEQEEMTPMKSLRSLLRCPMCSKTFSNQKNMDIHIKFHDDNVDADDNNIDINNADCGPLKIDENTSDSDSNVELKDDDDDGELIHSDGEMSTSQKANPAKRKPSRYKKVFKPRNKKLPFTQCEICLVNYSCEAAVEKCRVVNHNIKKYVCCHSCRRLFGCHLLLVDHRIKRPLTNSCFTRNPKDLVPAAAPLIPLFPFQKKIMGRKFCEVEGCYEVFNYEENLTIHAKTHGKWICTFCPEEFEKAHDFAAHELSKHNNSKKPATEDEIREAGNSNEKPLDISGTEAIGTQRLSCSRCKTSYEKRAALMDHFLHKHLDIPKPLETSGPRCEICERTFHPRTTEKRMKEHEITHDVEGLAPEQISRYRQYLRTHLAKVHGPSAAKTLPTQSYTKPFDQEIKEKVITGEELSEPGNSMEISSD
ncbi:unnamed protein product [Orchesella dallaii]|uniref:C2H2-type domain-containing protein n=1 Tax=Orchesella dallaii TaxID=48710 RepID=A0ABP1S453_9HEXA